MCSGCFSSGTQFAIFYIMILGIPFLYCLNVPIAHFPKINKSMNNQGERNKYHKKGCPPYHNNFLRGP